MTSALNDPEKVDVPLKETKLNSSYGWIMGQTGPFKLSMATYRGEGENWIQSYLTLRNWLCRTQLVADRMGKYIFRD